MQITNTQQPSNNQNKTIKTPNIFFDIFHDKKSKHLSDSEILDKQDEFIQELINIRKVLTPTGVTLWKGVITKIEKYKSVLNKKFSDNKIKSQLVLYQKDPIRSLISIQQAYCKQKNSEVKTIGEQIHGTASKIGDIKQIWAGIYRTQIARYSNDTSTKEFDTASGVSDKLNRLEDILKKYFNKDLSDLFGLNFNKTWSYKKGEVSIMDRSVTAFVDSQQADTDQLENKFKSTMRQYSSAKDEISKLRNFMTQYTAR